MSSGKNKKINVLVVEDSPTQAEHLKLILEKAGYDVSVARNGKEALSLLETTPWEMVISDIVMPEMDGYELCRTIKQDERFKQIPVILVTVLYDPQDVIRGLECGANNFITKPYDEKYLLSRIEIVLASSFAEETEKFQIGLEISFAGKKHHIAASRLQILNMLLSTYETAVQKNQELTEAKDQLGQLNEHLEDLVAERTLELEKSNIHLLKEIEVRKKTEEALKRKTRAYQVISDCNQFMVRTSDVQDLIKGICEILSSLGGYRCAWVGYVRHDKEKTIEPVALSGFEEDYLNNLRISWKKGRHGKGPTGTAIRTGKPSVEHNIQNNPKCGSWRSDAIKRDYSTVAAFPLIIQEQVIGALTIYSGDAGAFDSNEMLVLAEMAGDLAFGIASIRIKMERNQAEEQLKHFNEDLEKQVAERTEALNKSLHEKDILFKEVHHRVKNNMQIIISLLNLQSRTINDPVVLKTIKDSQSRIRAMGLVHEKLYQSGDISSIDLKDYIQFLARELFSFYGVKSQLIRFTINAPAINVNIDTAIPLGLMVNELISNAIKYAFPDDRRGEIVIDITKDKNEISLLVRDNGVGIPEDFDLRNAKSLGLRLVNSLVEQLQGTVELDRSAGTTFAIVVKEKE